MFRTTRHQCHACRKAFELTGKPGRRDECPHCGAELHVCLNCKFHDPALVRGCRETQAEEVREKERANFCSWFEIREGVSGGDPRDEAARARAAFDSLFAKK